MNKAENSESECIDYSSVSTVSDAVRTRRSLRAFLPKPVSEDTVREIVDKAARAPSGTNTQPWNTYILFGEARDRLADAACQAFDDPDIKSDIQVPYYPEKWFDPYLARRRQVGWQLYGLLGIKKGERERTHAQHRRNYQFFDAPVGMMFTVHKDLSTGSWLDYGMFLQNIMLLAREQGLHTCPQAAWSEYHAVVREHLPFADDEVLVCGMAMGYADPDAVENTLVTERVSADENIRVFY